MKKLICTLLAALTMTVAAFAVPVAYNETSPDNWTDLNYTQVPIYKVLDSKEAYVIIYAKSKYGVGQTVVPKKWAKTGNGEYAKLKVRGLGTGKLKPFMTVVKKGNEFHHVILTVPVNKADTTWGLVNAGVKVEGADKEVLEELEL